MLQWKGDYLLHVVETVKDRRREFRSHQEKDGQFLLAKIVVMFVILRCEFKVLLDLEYQARQGDQLQALACGPENCCRLTLNKFFSSLKLFSFFSRSLLSELLCRS